MGMQIEMVDPHRIQQLHGENDPRKVADLAASMTDNGWTGAPIVVIPGQDHGWGAGDPQAITGSHRIAAARQVEIDVPTIDLNDLLAEHGLTLASLDEEYGVDDDAAHYEAIRRLDEHLPGVVVDYYGLDAH